MTNPAISGQTQEELKAHILAHGCYSAQENLRIYHKWFSRTRPRDRLFDALDHKYGITKKGTLCDVGCSYGMNLLYCTAGSYGIELEQYNSRFAQSIGLTVYNRNVIEDDLADLPKVDTVWCTATIEHVDAPHIFLRKLYNLLKPGGLILLEVPVMPPAIWLGKLPKLGKVFLRYAHEDHINAFTVAGFEFMCLQAGFRTVDKFRWSTPIANHTTLISPTTTRWFPFNLSAWDCVYIGRSVPDWEYPPKATRRAANNQKGYVFVGQSFPEQNKSGEENSI